MKKVIFKKGSVVDPNWPKYMFVTSNPIHSQDLMLLEMNFDQSVTDDIYDADLLKKQTLLLRGVCKSKIQLYWLELILIYIHLGKSWASERIAQQKVYRRFLKGNLTILEFNTQLLEIAEKFLKEKDAQHA